MRNGDVATLSEVYRETADAAWTAKTRAMAVEVMGASKAADFTNSEAWGAVATHLHAAQEAGMDPAELLSRAVNQRGFGGAQDPAAVLAWRLEQQIEAARAIIDNTDRRPLGNLTDKHLEQLAERARAAQTQPTVQDPQWVSHPYALVPSAQLAEAKASAEAENLALHPELWDSTTSLHLGWVARTMGAEQERRAGLSPEQTTVEQIARGERPRTDTGVSIGEAITAEQQVRAVAAKTLAPAPVADGRRVSEDLAPTPLITDPQVPVQYREQLERLRTRLEERVMVHGAELAEAAPEWTAALGPVPAKPTKAAEWHQAAAEVEAYRNRYNVPAHETALIPKAHQQDPVAAALIQRATALHKHSALTTAAPQTPDQVRQTVDEAHVAERVRTTPAPAQEAVETLRATRAEAADPLPAPQAREAAVTEAATAPVAEETRRVLTREELIAHVMAQHRAQTQQATPTTDAAAPHEPASSTPEPQKKESPVSENAQNDATRRQFTSGVERKQADAIKRYKAARRTEQKSHRQDDNAAATRRAADAIRREGGRSL